MNEPAAAAAAAALFKALFLSLCRGREEDEETLPFQTKAVKIAAQSEIFPTAAADSIWICVEWEGNPLPLRLKVFGRKILQP